MAISSKKPLSFPHLAFTTILLMLMLLRIVSSLDSLHFVFSDFAEDEKNLIFQGDAHINSSNNILQLTKINRSGAVPRQTSVGRALFSTPVRLWQKSTGRKASFDTTFTFKITAPTNAKGDGFTFFIASPETTLPDTLVGGFLGLFNESTAHNASANQLLAVEFDTFVNKVWDPNFFHIGIDVNTIDSSAYVQWDRIEGAIGTVRVTYDAATQNLNVSSSYPSISSSRIYSVSHVVDLSTVLPEWVRVGFSGSSGGGFQLHDIHNWVFSSSLPFTNAEKEEEEEEDMYIAHVV